MSKKSDFTQKLLSDLRLRKQRLASAQAPSSDGPEHLYRPYQGQGDNLHKTKAYQPSHGRRKPLAAEEISTAIVPIQAARSREYITDLSMALAFALENGGRLGNIQFLGNPAMQKKASSHLALRRSFDLGEMRGKFMTERNQLVPSRSNLSHIHITEISKGAQRLNQILKACSQGLNFDGYSIEIGKELLKGAVDLEESLRMLVSLQEASRYIVSPQRKHQVQLREVDDDEEAEIVTKLPEKPRFSFDKSSRNSIAHGRETKKSSIPAQKLPVQSHAPNSKIHQPDTDDHSFAISNSVSHRGSVNFDPEAPSNSRRNARSNKPSNPMKSMPPVITANNSAPTSKNGNKIKQSSSQTPEQEKARIPNVIAKLMGLEEVPAKTHSKDMERAPDLFRQATRKQENSKQEARRSIRQVDAMISNYEKPVSQITQQVMVQQANGIAASRNTTIVSVQNISTVKGTFERGDFYINPQTSNPRVDRTNQAQFAKMEVQGREITKRKGHASASKSEYAFGRGRAQVSTTDFQEKHREYEEAAYSENVGLKKSTLQKLFKNSKPRTSMLGGQREFVYDRESRGPSVVQKLESTESSEREIEKNSKSKTQVTETRKTRMVSKILKEQMLEVNIHKKMLQRNQMMVAGKKGSIQTASATQPKENESSTFAESNMRKSVHRSMEEQALMAQRTDTDKAASIILPAEPMKMINLSVQKGVTEPFEAQEYKMTEAEETKNRMGGYPQDSAQGKQKTSVLEEVKQGRHEQIMKVKESIKSIPTMELEQNLQQKNLPASTSCDYAWDDGEGQKETEESTADYAWDDGERRQETEESTAEHARDDGGRQKETKESITACHNIDCIDSNGPTELPPSEISLGGDQLSKSDLKAIQSKGTGTQGNNAIGNSNAIIKQLQSHAKPKKQGRSLTKHEKHLKEILLNSQHFLNAAEALFRLQIPIEILHNSHNKRQKQSNQLVLDCAYEIMKRKGEREELIFHPSVGMPIASIRVKCLDDLVKVLHEDMEHLEFHGESGGATSDTAAAAYLQDLLKGDVQERKADVNCMWDLGWNVMTFAYLENDEVVKDVEKHISNRLIDEIIGDILHISIGRN